MFDLFAKTRVLDANARWWGIGIDVMMDRVGQEAAKYILSKFQNKKTISIICGLGNNGGDGLATARYLIKDFKGTLNVYLVGRESDIKSEPTLDNYKTLKELSKKYKNLMLKQDTFSEDIEPADVVIEAILGTGIKGRVHKRFGDILRKLARMKTIKLAMDYPAPYYKPDTVLSVEFPKTKNSEVLKINIPEEVYSYVGPGEIKELYTPAKDSYKYQNGELFVFGGSDTFHGAPLMAIKAASKFVGTVYFYTTPGNRSILNDLKSEVCEFITVEDNDIEKYANYADAFLIGPGLKDNLINRALIKELFNMFPDKGKVIDAYAIAMAPQDKLKNCILTPHRGELRHIWKDQTPFMTRRLEGNLRRFAKETEAVINLKGNVSILFNNDGEIKFNKTGNQGMAKGGTGDILAGITAAFLTKNEPWLAVQSGAFINGLAGDLAMKDFGYNYSATDLIPYIQRAVKDAIEF